MSIIMKWFSLVFSRDFLSKRVKNEGSAINWGHFATEKGAQMQISINVVQIVCNFLFISVASKHLPHRNIKCPWCGCEMSHVQNNAARRTGRVRPL